MKTTKAKQTAAGSSQPYEEFAQALQAHVKSEERTIETYERLLTLQDPLVTQIVDLILNDERHHHALMLETVAKMGKDYWAKRAADLGRQLPEVALRRSLREVVELRNGEAIGAVELSTLAEKYLKTEDLSARAMALWTAQDSTKHELLLQLLADYLEQQLASARWERAAAETGAI